MCESVMQIIMTVLSTNQLQDEMRWVVFLRERACVSHTKGGGVAEGKEFDPNFFSDPGLAGVQFCHMFTCLFRLNQWAQIKLCRVVRQQDILIM